MRIRSSEYYEAADTYTFDDGTTMEHLRYYIIVKEPGTRCLYRVYDCKDRDSVLPDGSPCGSEAFENTFDECRRWVKEHLRAEHKGARHGR